MRFRSTGPIGARTAFRRFFMIVLVPCMVAAGERVGIPVEPEAHPSEASIGLASEAAKRIVSPGRTVAPEPARPAAASRRLSFEPSAELSFERRYAFEQPLLAGSLGFPDLASRAVSRWQPMIVWRDRVGALAGEREPVAQIGCMGISATVLASRADAFLNEVVELAFEHGVSASLLKAVITEESCFDAAAQSHAGAQGLMQLMPATARWLGVQEPLDAAQNMAAGTRYLADLLDEFDDVTLALAAYNAGPGTVRRHGGVPPYAETERYVQRVRSFQRRYAAAARLATR